MAKELIKNVVCPFCGSACDDIEVEVEDGKILNVYNACSVGTATFFPQPGVKRFKKPLWREKKTDDFQEIEWETALDKAAEILTNAKRPLMFGWCETSCETMRMGTKVAELTQSIMDSQITHCHGPTFQAIQMVGEPTCTLGEIKNRADVVVYWGCNPLNGHPRHLSRYSSFPRGFFREEGRLGRKLIVVDPRYSDTAKAADHYYKVNLGEDYLLFNALRAVVNGVELEQEEIAGVKKEDIVNLAEMMKKAAFGIVFFGMGLTHSLGKSQNIAGAIQLVQLLNGPSKWSIMPLCGHYNVNGFAQVMSWTAGFPYSVDFCRGAPRYNPGEYTSIDMLQKGLIDAMFVISADPGSHMPQRAVEHMVKIPLIVSEMHPTSTTQLANLILPATVNGIEAAGTCYRMDGVPLHMTKVVDPPKGLFESDTVMMKKLYEKVLARQEED
ncbi:MAG: formylmethanofuran dehydrogenase subunit B [Candidatus Lokiarchaeota archaeon]|nr:formylmethanofuran dehydrogenase subunit B [Candidatus Lokiarchaeota archaeon]